MLYITTHKIEGSCNCVHLLATCETFSSFFLAQQPTVGQGPLIHEVSRSHSTTQHSLHDSSGRGISSSQRPLPDNTQHSQQTNAHTLSGIRTHNLSRRAAADLRLRPRGHWDRQPVSQIVQISNRSHKQIHCIHG